MLSAVRFSSGEFATAVAIALGGIVGIAVAWWLFRRWWRRRYAGPEQRGEAWTLQQLRELKIQGQITDEEFARLRSSMIAGVKDAAGRSSSKSG